ncbi:MAG: RagB/SusD family nutrient uptake outer membrane protein [Odoribacter splanchnicus]
MVEAYRESVLVRGTSITSSVPQNLTGYWLKKGSDSEVSNVGYNNAFMTDYPCVLIRLADLYLMKAEAWNEYLAVPDEGMYTPLNEVRRRAGIPDVGWKTYAKNREKWRQRRYARDYPS